MACLLIDFEIYSLNINFKKHVYNLRHLLATVENKINVGSSIHECRNLY